ncbi:MAG: hypothetical protein JWO73_322 [Candidatus Taylorbacteria bacterium]|nr:hypothetical protein [Candidatus Taylorbacteria bacterium]
MKQPTNLADLFVIKLKTLYDIEIELVKAIPKMIRKATDEELAEGLSMHLDETKQHVQRLENIFEMLDVKPGKIKCEAIRGLVADAQWVMDTIEDSILLDINICAAAGYIEHYEIAGYTTAYEWASSLDEEEIADILGETLAEEKSANESLLERSSALITGTL